MQGMPRLGEESNCEEALLNVKGTFCSLNCRRLLECGLGMENGQEPGVELGSLARGIGFGFGQSNVETGQVGRSGGEPLRAGQGRILGLILPDAVSIFRV